METLLKALELAQSLVLPKGKMIALEEVIYDDGPYVSFKLLDGRFGIAYDVEKQSAVRLDFFCLSNMVNRILDLNLDKKLIKLKIVLIESPQLLEESIISDEVYFDLVEPILEKNTYLSN